MNANTKEPVKFINFLDKYQTKRQNIYNEYLLLRNAINHSFLENRLHNIAFTGTTTEQGIHNDFNYYSNYSQSRWNNASLQTDYHIWQSKYNTWQQNHEVDISLNAAIEPKYICINDKISSFDDLIHIINTNEYDKNVNYNIDLKSLHNIKDELIQMNTMIGMDKMKKSVLDQLLYFIQDLHVGNKISEFKHTVIYGPPGSGKTEIAKIIGVMYSKIGILKNNVFKKVTRNDLIAGYLGQTAIKTRKVIDECIGGVLFIDEAYSLASAEQNDSYSKECLDTLCEALSDNKDNLMVIIAGYEEELEETFFKANRGLESRFIWRFKMEPYQPNEMMRIFKKQVIEHEWSFENESDILEKWFHEKKDEFKSFGRDMELLFSYTKIAHSRRIYGKDKELRKKISLADMNAGFETLVANKNKKPTSTFMHSIYV